MEKRRLGDIATVLVSNVDKKSYTQQKKVKLCNYTDVYRNWAISSNKFDSLMESTASELEIKRFKLQHGDVALTKDSETRDDIGKSTYFAGNSEEDIVLGYHCALVRPNEKYLDGKYLNSFFHTEYAQKYFGSHAGGSGQRFYLSVDSINDFPILLPSLQEQKIVGDLLSAIDRKIEINNLVCQNLEQQLKTIYEYWFIQFDFPNESGNPYQANGGEMVWNEDLKRKIPADWEVISLRQMMRKNNIAFDYLNEQPTLDLSVMPSDSICLDTLNISSNFSTNLYVMKKGDILFGSIRPYLHKAGFAPCDGAVAGTVHSFHVLDESYYNFVLFTVSRNSFFDYAVNVSAGTKMPVVNSDYILDYKVPYSPSAVKKFNEVSVMDIISHNIMESLELTKMRNLLLPLILNGHVSIMD